MSPQQLYRVVVYGTVATLVAALWRAGSPPAFCGGVMLLLCYGLDLLRAGRPLALSSLSQIFLYCSAVAYLVGSLGWGRAGQAPFVEFLLLLAVVSHLSHGDRGGSMFSLLCQLMTVLLLQNVARDAVQQVVMLLLVLPLLVLQLVLLAIVESEQQAFLQRLRNHQRVALAGRGLPPLARLDRGFFTVAGGVLGLFLLAVGAIHLSLPRSAPPPKPASTGLDPRDNQIDPKRRYPGHRLPRQMDISSFSDPAPDMFVASVRLRRGGQRYRAVGVGLYWKLVTYDRFDGQRWSVERGYKQRTDLMDGAEDRRVTVGQPSAGDPPVRQFVRVVPLDPPALPVLDRLISVDREVVWVSPGQAVFDFKEMSGRGQLREFEALSAVRPLRARSGERARHRDPRYTKLPRPYPKVLALVRREIRGERTDDDRVRALARYLRQKCRYRRRFPHPGEDSVAGFLFRTRRGHCELFASSLVVMLRSIAIPARVVGGFQGGKWVEMGAYYQLRRKDMHAWVEVHFEQTGWIRYDPTPTAARVEQPTAAQAGKAAAPDSVAEARAQQGGWLRTALFLDARSKARLLERLPVGLLLWLLVSSASLLAAIWTIGRWRGRASGQAVAIPTKTARPSAPEVPFYLRTLQLLGEAGLDRGNSETVRELGHRVFSRSPGAAEIYLQLAWHYQRVRFGGAQLAGAELGRVERLVEEMARALGSDCNL